MQDLVEGMGINRASMYQTYGNKHALFIAAIDQYIETSLAEMAQLLDAPGSPLGNLRRLFEHIIEQSLQGKINGCFINNSAVELGPHDPVLAERVRCFWNQFEALFNRTLIRAIADNELGRNADTEKLATLLNSTLQGLVIKTKTRIARESLFTDMDVLFSLIKSSG